MSDSRKEFISEAEDLLNESREALLEIQESLPGKYDPDTLNALFRAVHTLKGLSGLYGHEGLNAFSHELENLLDDLRLGKIGLDIETVDFLFRSLDALEETVRAIGEGTDLDAETHIDAIRKFRTGTGGDRKDDILKGKIDERITRVLSEYEEHRLRTNMEEGNVVYSLRKVFALNDFDQRLSEITSLIKEKGELISTLPTSEDIPDGSIGFELVFASEASPEELAAVLGEAPVVLYREESSVTEPEKPEAPSLRSSSSLVKVDISKLDKILNTIGKLNLTRSAIGRIEEEIIEAYGHSHLIFDMHRVIQGFERRLRELQEDVLEIRMVPIGQIFSRLGQVVRRTARQLGKEVDFQVFGEETEIDKYIAEEISDPLMHIIRNSLDHGIESPDERVKAGKEKRGRITLKAFPRGNHVIIEIEDDGKGIDLGVLREKGLRLGLIRREEKVSDEDILGFIFRAGFSTKEDVSELSGRGVGMDVVKEKVSGLGGLIEVKTEPGKFTRFSITIPITLAIIRSLFVRTGGQTFAIPLTSISETLTVQEGSLQSVEGNIVINLRGEPLPAMSLSRLLDIPGGADDARNVIVAGTGERRVGIMIDEILDSQDIVVKTLGEYFAPLRGFTGAAEVGRNEVVLVIDVEALVEEIVRRHQGVLNV